MAPRTRLSLLIVAVVGVVALLLSVLYLYGLAEAKFEDVLELARVSGEQAKTYLLQRVQEGSAQQTFTSLDETKQMWRRLVHEDADLAAFLVGTIASSSSVVEILIADQDGLVLSASNPMRQDRVAPAVPSLLDWRRQRAFIKLYQVLSTARDLELRVPLGVGQASQPTFTIHVVVSSVLLRNAVVPQLKSLALAGLLGLVLAAFLAGLISNRAARPLERLSEMIDLITQGKSAELPPASQDRELAAIQSKLELLGEQVRGAAEHASQLRGNVEQLLERLEDAVLLFDRHGKLIMAGKAAERFLGQGRWELMGRSLEEVFPESTPMGALIQASLRVKEPLREHGLEVKLPDGAHTSVLVSVEWFEDYPGHQPLGTMVTLRDAESRQQLESQLDVSYRREALGRILRGVAHEIKNPLNSIHLHLQMLKLEVGEKAPAAQPEIDVISREIKNLDWMVVTLLDFTRPLELKFADIDLVALAREIAGLVGPEAARKGLSVEVEADTEDAVIRADPALLRQAVMNVVVNGLECMGPPGRLTIQIERRTDALLLLVADQGPGIAPEIRDKIFNLYFTTKGRGSGIGLAMTYRVVELHNGTIDFTSEAGKGTTFRFRFPSAGKPCDSDQA
jgi:PAS domain S-box-containing protein